MYRNSEAHLSNLAEAREIAKKKTEICSYCKGVLARPGLRLISRNVTLGRIVRYVRKGFSTKSVTCSHACANTYFRTGESHPNWKQSSYRTTCFLNHEKRCVVCGEDKIVEVHHLDEDKLNNLPENLIPLCPTHHQYWHSRFRYLIEDKVLGYIKHWKVRVLPP